LKKVHRLVLRLLDEGRRAKRRRLLDRVGGQDKGRYLIVFGVNKDNWFDLRFYDESLQADARETQPVYRWRRYVDLDIKFENSSKHHLSDST
jgi:hypothetical protein